ncbi:MAG TPA: hypothetical protein VFL78_03885 [Rhodanobacteraceae bacterium]|jgi:hypothetical protein|nr:hypothetical protein [Rhodanobacteraceae bacterium]
MNQRDDLRRKLPLQVTPRSRMLWQDGSALMAAGRRICFIPIDTSQKVSGARHTVILDSPCS